MSMVLNPRVCTFFVIMFPSALKWLKNGKEVSIKVSDFSIILKSSKPFW